VNSFSPLPTCFFKILHIKGTLFTNACFFAVGDSCRFMLRSLSNGVRRHQGTSEQVLPAGVAGAAKCGHASQSAGDFGWAPHVVGIGGFVSLLPSVSSRAGVRVTVVAMYVVRWWCTAEFQRFYWCRWPMTSDFIVSRRLHAEMAFDGAEGNLQKLLDRNKKLFYQLPTDALNNVISADVYKWVAFLSVTFFWSKL